MSVAPLSPRKTLRAAARRAAEPEPLLWEKQKGESQKAFHAFSLYRDLGATRSLSKVEGTLHETGTAGPSMVKEWSSRWRWVERADAWDREEDRKRTAERDQARAEANRLRAESGHLALGGGVSRLRGDPKANPPIERLDLNDANIRDVVRLLEAGSKLLSQAYGETFDLKGSVMVSGAKVQEVAGALAMIAMNGIEDVARAVAENPSDVELIIIRHQDAALNEAESLFRRTTRG